MCAFPIYAENLKSNSNNLLICPQCGAWKISNSSVDGFVSDIVLVSEHRVVIQGCGIFFYENAEIGVKSISDTRHTYQVDLTFHSRTEDLEHSFVCGGDNEAQNNPRNLHLSIDVKGHFYEGGYADFTLHRQGLKEPLLSFRGWNIDREDPCGIGDAPGFGSLACNQTANGFLKKELWIASAKANANSSKLSQKKCLSQFNPVNFMSKVESYCSNREKESGGFYWPEAWAENCASNEYAEKIHQLLIWNKCVDSSTSKSSCVFPVENVCGERCNYSQNQ
jgi:hypothetical protein